MRITVGTVGKVLPNTDMYSKIQFWILTNVLMLFDTLDTLIYKKELEIINQLQFLQLVI